MSVSPFSMTIPSHSMEQSRKFYEGTVGCQEIAKNGQYIRYKFYNHELIVVDMGETFQPQEHCNHVDKYDVPVPHFGIVLKE